MVQIFFRHKTYLHNKNNYNDVGPAQLFCEHVMLLIGLVIFFEMDIHKDIRGNRDDFCLSVPHSLSGGA